MYGEHDIGQAGGRLCLAALETDDTQPRLPLEVSRGYRIDEFSVQWVLDYNGQRLLSLPPRRRASHEKMWGWNGDFLVVQENTLPELVTIQLFLFFIFNSLPSSSRDGEPGAFGFHLVPFPKCTPVLITCNKLNNR